MEPLSVAVGSVSVLVTVILGAVWVRSGLVKQRHEELEELAETRGHRIGDLEKQVAELRTEVAHLRGQVDALQALKVQTIVDGVILGLREEGYA